jgi:hypothetical protein
MDAAANLKKLRSPGCVARLPALHHIWIRLLLRREVARRGCGAEAPGLACPICTEPVLKIEDASYYGCRCAYIYHRDCKNEAVKRRQLRCPTCNVAAPHVGDVMEDLRTDVRAESSRPPPWRAVLKAAKRRDWMEALRLLPSDELRSLARGFGEGPEELPCKGCRGGFQSFSELCLLVGCRHRRDCYHRACADLAGACEACGAAGAVLDVHRELLERAERPPPPPSLPAEAPKIPERAFRFAAPCLRAV